MYLLRANCTNLEQILGIADSGEEVLPQRHFRLARAVSDHLKELGELVDEGDDARQQRI